MSPDAELVIVRELRTVAVEGTGRMLTCRWMGLVFPDEAPDLITLVEVASADLAAVDVDAEGEAFLDDVMDEAPWSARGERVS